MVYNTGLSRYLNGLVLIESFMSPGDNVCDVSLNLIKT